MRLLYLRYAGLVFVAADETRDVVSHGFAFTDPCKLLSCHGIIS